VIHRWCRAWVEWFGPRAAPSNFFGQRFMTDNEISERTQQAAHACAELLLFALRETGHLEPGWVDWLAPPGQEARECSDWQRDVIYALERVALKNEALGRFVRNFILNKLPGHFHAAPILVAA
jgi:uncharacterized repeat protein (TIGR04076 family)